MRWAKQFVERPVVTFHRLTQIASYILVRLAHVVTQDERRKRGWCAPLAPLLDRSCERDSRLIHYYYVPAFRKRGHVRLANTAIFAAVLLTFARIATPPSVPDADVVCSTPELVATYSTALELVVPDTAT